MLLYNIKGRVIEDTDVKMKELKLFDLFSE